MRKVFYLLPSLQSGGVQQVAYLICCGLKGLGWDVSVVAFDLNGPMQNKFKQAGIEVTGLNLGFARGDLKCVLGFPYLANLRRRRREALFMSSPGYASIVNALAGWANGLAPNRTLVLIDHLLSAHAIGPLHHRLYLFLAKRLFRRVSIVCSYIAAKADAITEMNLDAATNIRMIYNPIREDLKRADSPIWRSDFYFCGRLSEEKGIETFVDAALYALERNPNARFAILGEGSLLPDLKNKVKSRGREENFLFANFVQNPSGYLDDKTIFVLPSRREGCSGVLKEALSLGQYCIVTDVASGGPQEMILNGQLGTIIGLDDVRALGETFCHFLEHPPKLSQIATKERERLTGKFGKKKCVEEYSAFLLSMVDG